MTDQPPPKRRYNSARRQAQAAETRRQIVQAAGKLFAAHGYGGTTMDMLAREAGVAVETVYATFGNKRAILTRLVDVAVVGDEEPVGLLDRPGPQAVRRETDQIRQVGMFARDIRTIMQRMSPIFEILRSAAKTEPEIAALLEQILQARLQGMTFFIEALLLNGSLRPGLSATGAAETAWALSSAELYRLLTVDRGWSGEQYEAWLGESLILLLLPGAGEQNPGLGPANTGESY
jgi:AcrR family transcriptional regulator